MALKTCVKCGEEVSNKADVCPHCGRKNPTIPQSTLLFGWAVVFVILLCVVLVVVDLLQGDRSSRTPAAADQVFVPDPHVQQQRKELIDKLITQGVFTKVNMPRSISEAWVAPLFYNLAYDDKKQFCNVVYAYYFPDPKDTASGNHIRLRDS